MTFFVLSSCEIINPDEDIPSYIRIQNISLTTDSTTEGTNSHKITDAWVFVDDGLLGAYELPVTFPVLEEGNHKLTVKAGIKVSGIASMRDKYPYYDQYTDNIVLNRGEILDISPVIQYYGTTVFELIEDFEQPGTSLDPTTNSDTSIQIIVADTTPYYLSNNMGAVFLDATRPYFECITSSGQYNLPKGSSVFLELNYRCNNEFVVGIYKNTSSQTIKIQPSLYINPSANWNKIYVDLTNEVKLQTDALSFEIYISATKDASLTLAEIYLDNFKLVHY